MCASMKQSKILDNGDGTGQREDTNVSGSLKASAVSDGSDSQTVVVRDTTGGVGTVDADTNFSSKTKASTISNDSNSQNVVVRSLTSAAGAAPSPVGQSHSSIIDNGQTTSQRKNPAVTKAPKALPVYSGSSSVPPLSKALQSGTMDDGDDADIPNASKASAVSDGSMTDPNITKVPKASPVLSVSSSQNIEVRSSTSREGTPTQPLQSGVVNNGDGAGQHNDPNISNTPKVFSISGGSEAQHIVVLGPTGGGASSVFNLIIGEDVVLVSNDTTRCTTEATAYPIELGSAGGVIQCTLYDIPDFNSSPPALPSGDINLAVVCMEDRTPQVKEALHYLNDWAKHNGCNMPVLVVVNHMSPRPDPNWWETNKEHFTKLRLVAGHACLTRTKGQKNTEGLRSLIIELLSRRA